MKLWKWLLILSYWAGAGGSSAEAQRRLATQDTSIEIIRDRWGVPHIYAPTDAQVAYGFAWAQCEDDFTTLQEQLRAVKGLSGRVEGKEGVVTDLGVKLMGLPEIAAKSYPQDFSSEFLLVLEAYTDGINAYAKLHPHEVQLQRTFPIQPTDIVASYLLGLMEITSTSGDLSDILDGTVAEDTVAAVSRGSNALAIGPQKTTDGMTYLAINPHQPMEGWYSWYEAHLVSEEGMNVLGASFITGLSIFMGANEHLGWAHTLNYADFSDIYRLEMHPTEKNQYKFDGEWLPLKKKKHTAKMKLLPGLRLPIRRTVYESKYGPTFKTDEGVFAWHFNVQHAARAMEQWYHMNKAQNLEEFKAALQPRDIPSTNIIYADREGNIYYVSNGRIPQRNPAYRWSGVLPGDTSATRWEADFVPLDSLPQVLNPDCGYVFNTNNTPYNCTCAAENPTETRLNETMGFQRPGEDNTRAIRFMELIDQYEQLSYEDLKKIKFDRAYPAQNIRIWGISVDSLFALDPDETPELAEEINLLKQWNRQNELDNTESKLFEWTMIALMRQGVLDDTQRKKITRVHARAALKWAREKMLKYYGRIDPPLREVQQHRRGDKTLPIAGAFAVLSTIDTDTRGDEPGQYRDVAYSGETYIALIRFGKDGPLIESVVPYGASNRPESEHYTDQMDRFVNQQLKPMTLDLEQVRVNAERIYHPKRLDDEGNLVEKTSAPQD